MPAMSWNPSRVGFAIEHHDIVDTRFSQPARNRESTRPATDDCNLAAVWFSLAWNTNRLRKLPLRELAKFSGTVKSLASAHGNPGSAFQPGQTVTSDRTVQGLADFAPGNQFAVTDDAAVTGLLPVTRSRVCDSIDLRPMTILQRNMSISCIRVLPVDKSRNSKRRTEPGRTDAADTTIIAFGIPLNLVILVLGSRPQASVGGSNGVLAQRRQDTAAPFDERLQLGGINPGVNATLLFFGGRPDQQITENGRAYHYSLGDFGRHRQQD